MWLCKYDLSKECEGKYKDCTDCIFDKIRAEIEELDGRYVIGDYGIYGEHSPKYVRQWDVLQIIDKYKSERNEEECR